MKDAAFDPPPFRILTRASIVGAFLVTALAWANRRRLERRVKAMAARSLEANRHCHDELEAMLRTAMRAPPPRESVRENDRGRTISSRGNSRFSLARRRDRHGRIGHRLRRPLGVSPQSLRSVHAWTLSTLDQGTDSRKPCAQAKTVRRPLAIARRRERFARRPVVIPSGTNVGNGGHVIPDFLAAKFDVTSLEDGSTLVAIDRAFTIRWLNAAWERFAVANGGPEVASRFAPGSHYLDGITPPLRGFYEVAFRHAIASGQIFVQDYECSSPEAFRTFRLRALPCGGEGLLLEHSLVVERPHDRLPSAAAPWRYTRDDGIVLQCSHCRRVRRADEVSWDWVPDWVRASPPNTSHGLCTACLAFYWGVT